MIQLHQFHTAFGLPNLSPFCMKVETFLRMAKLPYEIRIVENPNKAPKGKAPFIVDDGKTVCDSAHILEYLTAKHDLHIDDSLTQRDRAVAHCLQRTIEERLYQVIVYSRWLDPRGWPLIRQTFFGGLPPVVRTIVPALVRKRVRTALDGHGIGRHNEDEIYAFAAQDIDAIATLLADKDFLMSDHPTTVDACAHATLSGILKVPVETPLRPAVLAHPSLVAYCVRMDERFYPATLA